MTRVLAVSPHLDDAVFSAGALLARLHAEGHEVTLLTVFTRSVPDPQGFALACQTDKGLGAEVDYMALRRAEDHAAARALGLPPSAVVHLPLPEAPHRGYASATELFAQLRPDDEPVVGEVAAALQDHVQAADLVLSPLCLGAHVDHRQVERALERLHAPRVRWHDEPYALKSGEQPDGFDVAPAHRFVEAKLDACATYATQLGFQFGGPQQMRAALSPRPERFDSRPVP